MILTISKWVAYLPLIGFLNVILRQKKENKILYRILQAVLLLTSVYVAGFVFVSLLGKWIGVQGIPYLFKSLRWNVHNIILFLIFMAIKIRKNRKKQQILFVISVTSCLFAITQIIFYYYLFLSNLDGLTPDIIGIISLCSMAILFIQGAILELMERNINTQSRQNEEEKKLLNQKYEQDYYLLTMEQKEAVMKLQEEMSRQLLKVQALIEHPIIEKEEEVQKLLVDMEEKVGKTGKVCFCKNSVLNTILALKYVQADKNGLVMKICVDSYMKTRVEDFDLCSIAANLIDNAVEASMRVRECGMTLSPINVHIGHRAGYLILKVENPMVEPLTKNSKGEYISSKKEICKSKKHGRGIKIVENTLEKYGGYLHFEENNGQMTVLAFIPSFEVKLSKN